MTRSELHDFMWLFRDYGDIFKILKKETIIDATFPENDLGRDIKITSEESVKSFIVRNFSRINFKKILLLMLNRVNEPNVVMKMDAKNSLLTSLSKYAKTKIPENDDTIVYFGAFTRDFQYKIIELTPKKLLYGHNDYVIPEREFALDKWYEQMLGTLAWNDLPYIMDGEKISKLVGTATIFEACKEDGYKYDDIIANVERISARAEEDHEFAHRISAEVEPVILTYRLKNRIRERNLYFMSLYRIQGQMEAVLDNPEILKKATPENLFEMVEFMDDITGYLSKTTDGAVIKTDDETVKIILADYIKQCRQSYSKISLSIINNNPEEIFNFRLIGLLNEEDFNSYIKSQKSDIEREYIYFARYIAGAITYKELEEKVKSEENSFLFRTFALFYNLADKENMPNIEGKSASEILDLVNKPENFFRKSLFDEALYEVLDDDYKKIFMLNSIFEFQSKGEHEKTAFNNLKALYQKGFITNEDLVMMYARYGLEINKIKDIIGEESLKNLYNPKDLVDTLKKIFDYGDKESLEKDDEEHFEDLVRRYEFYAIIYNEFGLIKGLAQEELINELDDLIYNDELFRKLYLDGFFTIETVYGFNENLAKRIYSENMLRDEDIRYMILNSDIELKLGSLIKMHEKGIISKKQVFELYMKKRISLDSLISFADGIDFKDVVSQKDLLDKAKRFNIVRKEEEQFKMYTDAFIILEGTIDEDTQKNLYKLLSSRAEDIAYIYSKGLIDIKNIENVSDSVLVELIKKGILKAEDAEFFFKDSSKLSKIMPYLEDEERINAIASVYSKEEDVPEELAKEMKKYLKAVMQKDKKGIKKKSDKSKRGEEIAYIFGEDQTEDISRRLLNICKVCRKIKPDCEFTLIGGTLVANLGDYVVAEDLYYTNAEGNNRIMQERATYIISKEIRNYMSYDSSKSLYENIIAESGFKIKESNYYAEDGYSYYFDWDTVRTYRRGFKKDGKIIRVPGIDKCMHVPTWEANLKKKVGFRDLSYDKQAANLLDGIKGNSDKDQDDPREEL